MTIKIYPGQQPSKPIEEHPWAGTLGDWFAATGQAESEVRVVVDGVELESDQISEFLVTNDNQVETYPLPF